MNKIYEHKKICDELNETYKKKNADYGDSIGELYNKLGDITILTRISDKYNRLMNLLDPNNDRAVNYESVDDTILDMANYCIIWLMERRLKNFKSIPATNAFGSFEDFANTLKESEKNNEKKLDDSGVKLKTSKDSEELNELLDELEKNMIITNINRFSEEEMIDYLEFIKEIRENLIEIYKHL